MARKKSSPRKGTHGKARPERADVFISYIHEDELFAEALQKNISSLLLGTVDLFVAGLITGIEPGKKWLQEIEDALERADAVIVLCSPASVRRPWINFEVGAAWMSLMLEHCSNLIPVCHGGLRPSELREPLSSLQALDVNSERDITKLIRVLAELAEVEPPVFDAKKFITSLPPSGKSLECQQRVLQEALEMTASKLRGKVGPEEIRAVITSIVKVWSQTLYLGDKPLPPIGVPPIRKGTKWKCKLCHDKVEPTPEACCTDCGLFCSAWLRDN